MWTTGARFEFEGRGTVRALARLPVERPAASIEVETSGDWEVTDAGSEAVLVTSDGVAVTVRDDSVLEVHARRSCRVRIAGAFVPEYRARKGGAHLMLDRTGGFGAYPIPARSPRVGRRGRTLAYALKPGDELWVAVFPTRGRSRVRHAQSVAHEGRPAPLPAGAHPDEALIAASARHCAVFALHAYFWRAAPPSMRPRFGRYAGRRCSWRTPRHEPEWPEEFARVAASVESAGMQLIVYLSPAHSRAPDLAAEVRRVLAEYPVDGLYVDGVARSLPRAHAVIRDVRRALGPDRVLYLNATNEPLGSPRVPCPFLDAQADFVLRGDAGRGGLGLDRFLRFAVSGWNTSNAVGLWCHYGSSGRLLPVERVPPPEDVDAALRNHVRLWRRSLWDRGNGELEQFDGHYYPAFDELVRRERNADA